eukprot:4815342-Alexandrium_andersonii.AAC.1
MGARAPCWREGPARARCCRAQPPARWAPGAVDRRDQLRELTGAVVEDGSGDVVGLGRGDLEGRKRSAG